MLPSPFMVFHRSFIHSAFHKFIHDPWTFVLFRLDEVRKNEMSQLLCRKGTHLCLVPIPIPIPVSNQTAHLFKPDAGSFCRCTHSQCEHDIRMCQVKTDAGQTHYKCEHLKIIKPCGLGLSKSQAQTQIPVPVPVTASAPACESETKQKSLIQQVAQVYIVKRRTA